MNIRTDTDTDAGPGREAGDRPAAVSAVRVGRTAVENAENPLGLDKPRPRLSWQLVSDEPDRSGQSQSAYRIRVATHPDPSSAPDVWDSGDIVGDTSCAVPYGGPRLRSRQRYFWSVRIRDERGLTSAWSESAWWETGLLDPSQWEAQWITAPDALLSAPDLDDAQWIWTPGEVPGETGWFRTVVDVPEGLARGRLALTAGGGYTAYVNGHEVDRVDAGAHVVGGRPPYVSDVTDRLRTGRNVLAVEAVIPVNGPAGVLGVLEITGAEGVRTHPTDTTWQCNVTGPSAGWRTAEVPEPEEPWVPVAALAPYRTHTRPVMPPAHAPVVQLRHTFGLADKRVARARLYATALGLYEAHLNGRAVGDDRLAPGWTDYRVRAQYRTHDVTHLLRAGENVLAVHLAAGWYAGSVGWVGPRQFGEHPALLAQLEVEYTDGSTVRAVSSPDWRASAGPVLSADLMAGEDYDARRETAGWTAPGFDDTDWWQVRSATGVTAEPVAQLDAPVRVTAELGAREVTEPQPGVHVFDLGQNMVGTVRLAVSGAAGSRIRLRYAEALDPDGMPYTANLRSARATDTYVLKGGGAEVYEPRFTFHGFRYVEVTGHPGAVEPSALTGLVLHTAAPMTFDFHTDAPMLNQLHSNICWGLRGNFLSVPTDTPARDERLGWTGDINVFAPTAAYLMESARFLDKWLCDLRDAQTEDGAFPDVAPYVPPVGRGVAGWGDAGVTVPWALYQAYGDRSVLEENWTSMLKWLDYLATHSQGRLRPAEGYGDWLNIDDPTPKDVVGTAYYAHSVDLVARIAAVIGEDPEPYRKLFDEVRNAFRGAYVAADGRVKGDSQTAYVLALSMDLLTAEERERAADRLVRLVEERDWHLSTGFLGTPRLLPALTAAGRTDVAYRLLHQRTFPSWGHQIDGGATTMWERWDTVRADGGFQDPGMNSFNHYAYGSVGQWMYRNIAGIAPAEPGFKRVLIRPRPGGEVTEARARFDSPYGPVATYWTNRTDAGPVADATADSTERVPLSFRLEVTLPVNTGGEVWVPAGQPAEVAGGDAEFVRYDDGCAVYLVGSGVHVFTVRDRSEGR